MRADRRRHAWLWLLIFAAAVPPTAAAFEAALYEVDRCLDRRTGAERIALAQECPELDRALRTGEGVEHLPPIGEEVERATLENLYRLLWAARFADTRPSVASMDYDAVAGILADVHQPVAQSPPGLWERFLRWLRGRLKENEDAAYLEPLKRFLDWIGAHVPVEQIAKLLFYGSLISLFILVVGLLLYQLGAIRGWPRLSVGRSVRRAARREAGAPEAPPTLAGIRQLPPSRQPAAVLRWCIDTLIRQNVLPPRRSYTNRELLRYLKAESTMQTAFDRLVKITEPCVYGGRRINTDRLEALYEQAVILSGEQKRPA